jgi:hypothetical protein
VQYSSIQDAWLSAHNHDDFIANIEFCTWMDVFTWIKQIPIFPKIIWHSREEDCVYFAVGSTSDTTQPLQFHVRSFDPHEPQWTGFPATTTIRPQHVVQWTTDTCTLRSVSNGEAIPMGTGLDPQDSPELPSKSQWTQKIEH